MFFFSHQCQKHNTLCKRFVISKQIFLYQNRITKSYIFFTIMTWKVRHNKSMNWGQNAQTLDSRYIYLAIFLISWSLFYVISKDKQVWKFLIWVLTAVGIVRAVVTLSHVVEFMDLGVEFGHPSSRDQEWCEVEQIHKHFVSITGKSKTMTFTPSHNNNVQNFACGHLFAHRLIVSVYHTR